MRDYPLTGVMYIHGEYDGDKGDVNGARTGEFIHRIYARFLRHFLKDSESNFKMIKLSRASFCNER
jgi:hypothetical protein